MAPRVPWPVLRSRLASSWHAGEHVTLIGPTRSGKTHMALELAELCPYVLVLATKRQDPLVSDLAGRGYHVTADLEELVWTAEHPRRPIQRSVVYWPQFGGKLDSPARLKLQAAAMREALDWADRTGGWCVVVDETMWMARNLRLERELESLWFQGRTQGVSVIACAQRPAHIPRLAFSSADYLFLWQTGDAGDLERLRDISAGFPKGMIEANVSALDFRAHEALFIDPRGKELARVIAPAR